MFCKKFIREKEGPEGISHGVCKKCMKREMEKIEKIDKMR
jgi:hypothetical protein